MPETSSQRDGFAIDESTHDIYRKLAKEKDIASSQAEAEEQNTKKTIKDSDSLSVPFSTMKDVFMWAACIGFQLGMRKEIVGKRRMIFRWAQFSQQTDIPILKAIAIADRGDVSVLLNPNEMMKIAEEYANAGIRELRSIVLEGNDLPLWNLVNMLHQEID